LWITFCALTVLVLSVLIAAAFAAPHEDVEIKEAHVEVEEAQFPFFNPMMMNPMMNQQSQQYPIDYSEI
jgi:hypothetical protein